MTTMATRRPRSISATSRWTAGGSCPTSTGPRRVTSAQPAA
eukprot:CAMPEP_0202846598 /NCGR_PEP_ID=MMETSP1389-20130828/73215_1 /ASSEMBLY_ACC=CAM_ASM_000865 /TAXON_ID=302021 /ORGANISM="Rhodomonas sp., Strain CCMP768" /LENGTH=40 /DNA_ID= /DNA_START= /DNA_END= /DNA_ORIENTATION=